MSAAVSGLKADESPGMVAHFCHCLEAEECESKDITGKKL